MNKRGTVRAVGFEVKKEVTNVRYSYPFLILGGSENCESVLYGGSVFMKVCHGGSICSRTPGS